jgi:hypothetical protein
VASSLNTRFNGESSFAQTSSLSIIGGLKWEDETVPSEDWTDLDTTGSWSEVSNPSTPWTDLSTSGSWSEQANPSTSWTEQQNR